MSPIRDLALAIDQHSSVVQDVTLALVHSCDDVHVMFAGLGSQPFRGGSGNRLRQRRVVGVVSN